MMKSSRLQFFSVAFSPLSWFLASASAHWYGGEGGGERGHGRYDPESHQPAKGDPNCHRGDFVNGVPCRIEDSQGDDDLDNDEDYDSADDDDAVTHGPSQQMCFGKPDSDDSGSGDGGPGGEGEESGMMPYRRPGGGGGKRPGGVGGGGRPGGGFGGGGKGPGGVGVGGKPGCGNGGREEGPQYGPNWRGRRKNLIRFNVFLALPPYTFSIGYVLKVVVTFYLQTKIPQYGFHLRQSPGNVYTRDASSAGLISLAWEFLNSFIQPREADVVVDNFLIDVDPFPVLKEDNRWWWRYRMSYHSFYPGGNHTPVLDGGLLKLVRRTAIDTLRDGVEILQDGLLEKLGPDYSMIWLQMEPPRNETVATSPPTAVATDAILPPSASPTPPPGLLAPSFPVAPPTQTPSVPETVVPTATLPPFVAYLDTSEWDWRRYVGLVMLLGTVSSTCCLVQLAGLRRRLRAKQQAWSNLATEEGVEELLRTSWKVHGNQMEVFYKKNAGYSDDSSMLIGGFEQREVVGAEITVTSTHPTSAASPRTRSSGGGRGSNGSHSLFPAV